MINLDSISNKYPFLNALDNNTKDLIKSSVIIKNFEPDYTLIHEGDSCIGFSLILKGSIRVYKLSDKGKEVTLYRLSSGDTCYLSMSCLLSNTSYPAFAEVLESTQIAFIPSNIFHNYVYDTLEFQKFMFNNLYSKYNEVLDVLEEVAFERMDVRIAKYLLLSSKKSNNTKYLYFTHEQISKELGTSREVVSRILTDFKNKDVLISQRGKITITDFDKLESISNL
ncbi:Crp/Fnr family transcriptional regulator [Romboutsia weinsteinii]|uniref:Crp/Fnr family transcriptional regulator n=1 Tax=Romboutsia weinsteinii TaxID=2020949 RepID=A0A371J1K1_9FIRM|nr:Crp/Fnr family transcriptional regulator [Romboutsia weinsteinii]RDY26538.1 Crp/Fnr family transcriptional regulator [Romboutsia weinsteinii]